MNKRSFYNPFIFTLIMENSSIILTEGESINLTQANDNPKVVAQSIILESTNSSSQDFELEF